MAISIWTLGLTLYIRGEKQSNIDVSAHMQILFAYLVKDIKSA